MATENITPKVASHIACVLGDVMADLRALNEVAVNSDDTAYDGETIAVLTQAICERSHVKLDACRVRLGAFPLGNYQPPFAESEEAAEGANHG